MSSEGGEVVAGASNQKTEILIFLSCCLLTSYKLPTVLRLLKMSQPFSTMCLADNKYLTVALKLYLRK